MIDLVLQHGRPKVLAFELTLAPVDVISEDPDRVGAANRHQDGIDAQAALATPIKMITGAGQIGARSGAKRKLSIWV